MKFKNPNLMFFEQMDGWMDGQAQSYMPLQFFQRWGLANSSEFANIIIQVASVCVATIVMQFSRTQ